MVPGPYTQSWSVTHLQVLWGTSREPRRLPGSSCLRHSWGVGGEASALARSPSLSRVPDLQSSGNNSCLWSVPGLVAEPCGVGRDGVCVLLGALGPMG